MRLLDKLISWIYTRRFFGPRCSEYEEGCIVCEQWRFHDEL